MKAAVCNSVGIDADGYAMIHSPSRWTNSTKDHNIFTYYPFIPGQIFFQNDS